MIRDKILSQKIKEFEIQEYVSKSLDGAGISEVKLQMTPLGEKIVIDTSKPGLVVGRKGQSIRKISSVLKKKFGLENPQVEINEVRDAFLNPNVVAERISNTLEKYGINRFKAVGHKSMENIMRAGALGVEILISGKVPSSRAKRWRFYQGYLKKSGDIAVSGVRKAYTSARLKSGLVGIQVRIMTPDVKLSDNIRLKSEMETVVEENDAKEEKSEKKTEKKSTKKKVATKKKTTKKKVATKKKTTKKKVVKNEEKKETTKEATKEE